MAKKTWLKVTGEFTRRIGASTVVGHPKHRDVRGRYLEVDDGAQVDALVTEKKAERISQAAYLKGIEEDKRPDAGEARLAKLAGGGEKVSVATKTEVLRERAAALGVDLSDAKNRPAMIKAINAKIDEQGGGAVDENAPDTGSRQSRTAGLTDLTTSHPPLQTAGETEVAPVDEADAAPAGGGAKDE